MPNIITTFKDVTFYLDGRYFIYYGKDMETTYSDLCSNVPTKALLSYIDSYKVTCIDAYKIICCTLVNRGCIHKVNKYPLKLDIYEPELDMYDTFYNMSLFLSKKISSTTIIKLLMNKLFLQNSMLALYREYNKPTHPTYIIKRFNTIKNDLDRLDRIDRLDVIDNLIGGALHVTNNTNTLLTLLMLKFEALDIPHVISKTTHEIYIHPKYIPIGTEHLFTKIDDKLYHTNKALPSYPIVDKVNKDAYLMSNKSLLMFIDVVMSSKKKLSYVKSREYLTVTTKGLRVICNDKDSMINTELELEGFTEEMAISLSTIIPNFMDELFSLLIDSLVDGSINIKDKDTTLVRHL